MNNSKIGRFVLNNKLPFHRWYKYSAGFSGEWVENIIKSYGEEKNISLSNVKILDPFVGSGTTLISARNVGASSVGIEAHLFMVKVAQAKLTLVEGNVLSLAAEKVIEKAKDIYLLEEIQEKNELLLRCYDKEMLKQLCSLKREVEKYIIENKCEEVSRLLWLALTGILRSASNVGTAQWQYVLPNVKRRYKNDAFELFRERIEIFIEDLNKKRFIDNKSVKTNALFGDSRKINEGEFDLVITSPPYPNNYDYADATRLEMTFWGVVSGWKDLHPTIRKNLMRSCSQHSAADKIDLEKYLLEPILQPIISELSDKCRELAEIRLTKGGKKTYHTMVAAYFIDMGLTWLQLRNAVKAGGRVAMVIGDAAPYGVHLPVDKWLAKQALWAGFHKVKFEKLRDRNIKWKNRKHTVPLLEGILWVEG